MYLLIAVASKAIQIVFLVPQGLVQQRMRRKRGRRKKERKMWEIP